jgi:hypothetical protein
MTVAINSPHRNYPIGVWGLLLLSIRMQMALNAAGDSVVWACWLVAGIKIGIVMYNVF